MSNISDAITAEGLADIKSLRTQATVQNTAASTITLTASSEMSNIFTGSVSGQIIKLADATTLSVGHRFEFYNKSTATITIKDNSGTVLLTLATGGATNFVLQVNTTAAGTWAWAVSSSSPFSGTAPITCGYGGNAVATRYLEFVSGNSSDTSPFVSVHAYTIIGMSIGGTSNSTCTVSLFKNGNFTTAIATLSTTANNNQYINTLNVPLAQGDLLTVAITSGSIGKPFVNVYLLGA